MNKQKNAYEKSYINRNDNDKNNNKNNDTGIIFPENTYENDGHYYASFKLITPFFTKTTIKDIEKNYKINEIFAVYDGVNIKEIIYNKDTPF